MMKYVAALLLVSTTAFPQCKTTFADDASCAALGPSVRLADQVDCECAADPCVESECCSVCKVAGALTCSTADDAADPPLAIDCLAGFLLSTDRTKCVACVEAGVAGTTLGNFFDAAAGTCTPCSAGCLACSAVDTCTTCDTANAVFLDTTVCTACATNCAECSAAAVCTLPNAGFSIDAADAPVACDGAETVTCSIDDKAVALTCTVSHFLDATVCEAASCVTAGSCANCATATTCTAGQCGVSFFVDSAGTTCTACKQDTCAVCTDAGDTCSVCIANTADASGNSVGTFIAAGVCTNCVDNCATCTAATAAGCSVAFPGFKRPAAGDVLVECGTGIATCQIGDGVVQSCQDKFVINTESPVGCTPCDVTCATCGNLADLTECTSCPSGATAAVCATNKNEVGGANFAATACSTIAPTAAPTAAVTGAPTGTPGAATSIAAPLMMVSAFFVAQLV